jgi:hypothetical protein
MPFTPVPAAEQREAVEFIVSQAFVENAFEFDAALLAKLAPNRWGDWSSSSRTPVDFPVHSLVEQIQGILLAQLMSPVRVQRMIDNELMMTGEAYTAAEMFNELTTATWSELAGSRARPVNSFRRNLQRMYTTELIDLMLSDAPDVPEDARSLSRLQLKRISGQIDGALGQDGLDDFTVAHIDETQARIQRALNAQVSLEAQN